MANHFHDSQDVTGVHSHTIKIESLVDIKCGKCEISMNFYHIDLMSKHFSNNFTNHFHDPQDVTGVCSHIIKIELLVGIKCDKCEIQ